MQPFFQDVVGGTPLMAAISIKAQELPFGAWFTNSIFVAVLVLLLVGSFAFRATKKMTLVPHPAQNFFEWVVEFLYGQVEGIVGRKVAPRAFPLLATLFIFILVANWMSLIPGVGTLGWGQPSEGFLSLEELEVPLLRPATADLNMTLGMAASFMLVWAWVTISEIGVFGFLKHTFAPKGGLKGMMWWALLPIFFFVGMIEILSIAFRPVSLSLRLFGNIYAGETLLHTMSTLGDKAPPWVSFLLSVALPLPFYFLELLVGLLQAMVFALLCAVYIQLSTAHEEEHH
jgi:F-type H+-transporting ATPase subunit a